MSYRKQKKNTTKLPKLLQDELVSLGKLDARPTIKRGSQGRRGDWIPPHLRKQRNSQATVGRDVRKDDFGTKRLNTKKPVRPASPVDDEDESEISEDDGAFDDEDRTIAELEKKLGMGKGKKSKLGDEELDGLLEGLESFKRGTKRKADSETTKPTKYRIAQTDDTVDDEESSEDDSNIFDDASEFEGFSDASEAVQQKSAPLVTPTGKYIPPAARKANPPSLPDQTQDPRLHKQIQGMLNRLSESNMSTILSEIEVLYRTYPRASVSSTLTNLLLTILSAQHTLLDTFVILHAGFVAALYRLIGTDFGAYLVQTLVERFDKVYPSSGKEAANFVVFLSELYNFGMVGAGLIYDFIRMFLENLGEFDTELLLKVIQNSGQQLRQDDPSALKDIVILMQSKIAEQDQSSLRYTPREYSKFSVRTKFMVETIINLKNNRAKATTATSVVTSEATIRMKKFLGKMGEKNLRSGGEPLRVTLNDIRNVKEKGKWWLVGASWKNDEISLQPEQHEHKEGDELLSLAREQRMNTEIRRAVFIALMGSQDYMDATTRILLLPLKKAQRTEIPRVLVHCCSNEAAYNPFYALVAKRLCSPSSSPQISRVVRIGLQFNLWSAFREWGETTDADWDEEQDDLDESGKLRKAVNLAKLYGSLIADGVISLQILKVLGFINLQSLTKTFLEVFFTEMILHSQVGDSAARNADPLLQCTYKLVDTVALAKGIDWYLRKKNVEKAGLTTGDAKACVAWGVTVLRKGVAEIFQQG